MNPHTATLTELRDWFHRLKKGPAWKCLRVADTNGYHLFPPTLDGAASAMPEGWWWNKFDTLSCGTQWVAGQTGRHRKFQVVDQTSDETTDRYRLAALCVLAEKENKHGN